MPYDVMENQLASNLMANELAPQTAESAAGLSARSSLVALPVSLDEVDFGLVLLDGDLRATFVNRAFRQFWRLDESDCEGRPSFPDLMRRGKAALTRSVPRKEFEDHVEAMVLRVRTGDPAPIDIRLPNREVLRFQCVALPGGGRMLSYTRVTDIFQRSDEMEVLQNAIDNIEQGIVLINDALLVQFVNKKARAFWNLSPDLCKKGLTVAEFIAHVRSSGLYDVPDEELESYVIRRVTMIKTGDPTPFDIPIKDGRTIRVNCTALVGGGRMLTYTDVTDLIQRARQQEYFAVTDPLTGLYNRRYLLDHCNREFQRAARRGQAVSMVSLDVDHFKSFNDNYGHDAGDAVLKSVGDVLRETFRSDDIPCRLGGEEFVILLPDTPTEVAASRAEELRRKIEKMVVRHHDGVLPKVTVSVGVASYPEHGANADVILKAADDALYKAKRSGRNTVAIADRSLRCA